MPIVNKLYIFILVFSNEKHHIYFNFIYLFSSLSRSLIACVYGLTHSMVSHSDIRRKNDPSKEASK